MDRTSARFWEKVEKSDGCWNWTARRTAKGYGQFAIDSVPRQAHRVAWELTNGPIPAGLVVRHGCDNPSCVRPDHLSLGTQADNVRDAVLRRRHARGERNGAAKLTSAAVLEIRTERAQGFTSTEIGARHGVSEARVRQICTGAGWNHLPRAVAA